MQNYRKIWEQHHGPIPLDSDGRRCEVHHIDGNRSNNDISNLMLVTIQQHYDIHYAQGDWAACQSVVSRMKLSPEQNSKIQSDLARCRIQDGTHPFVDPVIRKRIDRKTGEREHKKIKAGTSQLFSAQSNQKRIQSHRDAVAAGTHHTLTAKYAQIVRQNQYKLLDDGSHNFQKNRDKQTASIYKMIDSGTHPLQAGNRIDPNTIAVSCVVCRKQTTLPALSTHHKHNGAERVNPGTIKLCCVTCKKEVAKGAFTRWHNH